MRRHDEATARGSACWARTTPAKPSADLCDGFLRCGAFHCAAKDLSVHQAFARDRRGRQRDGARATRSSRTPSSAFRAGQLDSRREERVFRVRVVAQEVWCRHGLGAAPIWRSCRGSASTAGYRNRGLGQTCVVSIDSSLQCFGVSAHSWPGPSVRTEVLLRRSQNGWDVCALNSTRRHRGLGLEPTIWET